MSDYARLLAAATAGGSVSARLELLDHMRLHSIRQPAVVLREGQRVLREGGAFSLGERRWDISEQVALAALDVGADDVAEQLREELEAKFPGSQRVKHLEGMCCEAQRKWTEVSVGCFLCLASISSAPIHPTQNPASIHFLAQTNFCRLLFG